MFEPRRESALSLQDLDELEDSIDEIPVNTINTDIMSSLSPKRVKSTIGSPIKSWSRHKIARKNNASKGTTRKLDGMGVGSFG